MSWVPWKQDRHPLRPVRPAPPGLTAFLCRRNKQLIQVLGWLWDLSVTEEHVFSKAFFYFVCLDIMLYAGTCGWATGERGTAGVLAGVAAVGARVLRPLGFGLGRPRGLGGAEHGGTAEEPSGRGKEDSSVPRNLGGASCQLKDAQPRPRAGTGSVFCAPLLEDLSAGRTEDFVL